VLNKRYILVFGHRAEELSTAARQPVDSLLVEFDDSSELLLVLEEQRHVDVDVLNGAVVPPKLRHHPTVHLRLHRLPQHRNKLLQIRVRVRSENLVQIQTLACKRSRV